MAYQTQIQTRTGNARVTLNGKDMLIAYYNRHRQHIDSVSLYCQYPAQLYLDGWNMKNLNKVVASYEPQNKTNDNVK